MANRCVKVKVPVKVTLFGEHAVVYGYPAVAAAIDKYILFKICTSKGYSLNIRSIIAGELVKGEAYISGNIFSINDRRLIYVTEAVNIALSKFGGDISKYGSFTIDIESDLPSGVGLGTSASVSSGTILGILSVLNINIDPYNLADLARKVEIKVQGTASPMDTGTVSVGGVLLITPKLKRSIRRLRTPENLNLVVGYTPKKKTTYDMINIVKEKMNVLGAPINKIFEAIGEISLLGSTKISIGDIKGLSELININQKLLESLGVVIEETQELVRNVIKLGAYAAKMSGGGGGGAVFGIVDSYSKALSISKDLINIGYNAFPASISSIGAYLY